MRQNHRDSSSAVPPENIKGLGDTMNPDSCTSKSNARHKGMEGLDTKAGIAKLVIRRVNERQGGLRKYKIFLNNEKVGTFSKGEEKIIKINPGKYSLRISFDWIFKSNIVEFETVKGQTYCFVCRSNVKLLSLKQPKELIKNMFKNYLYVSFWSHTNLNLKLEDKHELRP